MFKRDAFNGGHIEIFCNELGIDASTNREGDLINMDTDKFTLSSKEDR